MSKMQSLGLQKKLSLKGNYKIFTLGEIKTRFADQIALANEIMCLQTDDNVMTVMRYFNWSIQKINDKWYDNTSKLRIDIGLDYDQSLVK